MFTATEFRATQQTGFTAAFQIRNLKSLQ